MIIQISTFKGFLPIMIIVDRPKAYTAWVEGLKGAISQGETLDEAINNLFPIIEILENETR